MKCFSERNVMKELQTYRKEQFEEVEVEAGEDKTIFYWYKFTRKGVEGYITARYDLRGKKYNAINMDCNFGRPAGYNNYSELKSVMDHIRYLFKK